jgi:ferredoxin
VYTLIVEPGGIVVSVSPGDTIDLALQKAGLYRPWGGCLQGGCGACSAEIIDSEVIAAQDVRFASAKGTSTTESGRRFVRACVAVPTTGMSVTFRGGKVRQRLDES